MGFDGEITADNSRPTGLTQLSLKEIANPRTSIQILCQKHLFWNTSSLSGIALVDGHVSLACRVTASTLLLKCMSLFLMSNDPQVHILHILRNISDDLPILD